MTSLPELEHVCWTLPRALAARATLTPDRPFVTTEGEGAQTFGECSDGAFAMAGQLRAAGILPGELVAVMAPNCRTAIHAWMGANLLGAADVMLNTGYRGSSLQHALNLCRAKVLLVEERYLGVLRESEPRLEHLTRIVHFRLTDTECVADLPAFSRIELVSLDALAREAIDPRDEPAPSSLAS